MENPLLKYKNDSVDSFIRFDLIKDEHFEPAFEIALAQAKENLKTVIENSDIPTFANTIEALEYISEDLDHVYAVFLSLKEAHTNTVLDELAQKISPIIADFSNDISLNEVLFKRVKQIYESKPTLENKEQSRLLEKTYKSFVRNGALLDHESKDTIRQYDKDLESLKQTFSENLLGATNEYELHILDEENLKGLPSRVKEMGQEEAKKRGKEGWIYTLKYPSMGPFMQYAENTHLRKDLLLAHSKRGMQGVYNNQQVVLSIVKLRQERSKVFGYNSHAEYVLEERMAKNPQNVHTFFSSLYEVVRPLADRDFQMLQMYKEKETGEKELYPWDISFYSEKIKKEKFDFDEELLRPYLNVDAVIEGVFAHAQLLYGISFVERKDIAVYDKKVQVFEAVRNGTFMGLLYLDLFPRESKRNGAWANMVRGQYKRHGVDYRPHVFIVASLTEATPSTPSLLTSDEVRTIFHEFGHALHVLLSDCQYKSLSGYNALWDFVELPSQLMESWLLKKESFTIFAKQYKTGEVLPAQLLDASLKADMFMEAWSMLSQMGNAVLDLAWHSDHANHITDVEEFEKKIREPYRLYKSTIEGTSISTAFGHIFNAGGGYAAGYYSYLWAEVLAADAFEYFKEKGLFSQEVAEKLRKNILSKGNTEDPTVLYKAFRGRDADPTALLRHKGLI